MDFVLPEAEGEEVDVLPDVVDGFAGGGGCFDVVSGYYGGHGDEEVVAV